MNRQESNKLMIKFFDERADKWGTKGINKQERLQSLLNKLVPENSRVLDVGCGTGVIDPLLINAKAKEVLAIDLTEKMIEKAKERNNYPNVKYEVNDIYEIDKDKFDFVVMYNTYVHLIDKDSLSIKINSILKDDGRFAIINNSGYKSTNLHHSEGVEVDFSRPLKPVVEEKKYFDNYFDIDVLMEEEDFYVISGKKK